MNRVVVYVFCGVFVLSELAVARAQELCVSGLAPGQKPGPYSFVVSTGKERGQSTCFICQTEDKPAVIIFARKPSDDLGKLAADLDKAVADPKNVPLRGWVTFISDNQPKMDPQVVQWGQKHAIRNLPLGVFEDNDGPPSYRLNKDAEVTILLFVKQKVVANFAFRAGELNDTARADVLKAVPKILEKK
ncbi:MAG TPA: hypothetical protein VKS79_16650 [Gemmataceae bacterium]|nr:hypothetical protein [Gemmataceae bacterium]